MPKMRIQMDEERNPELAILISPKEIIGLLSSLGIRNLSNFAGPIEEGIRSAIASAFNGMGFKKGKEK